MHTEGYQNSGIAQFAECGFLRKNVFFEKNVKLCKNMLTEKRKDAILSELLGTNCFYETDKEIMFQKK